MYLNGIKHNIFSDSICVQHVQCTTCNLKCQCDVCTIINIMDKYYLYIFFQIFPYSFHLFQALNCSCNIIVFRNSIKVLIHDSKRFWPINILDESSGNFLRKQTQLVSRGLLYFNIGCIVAVFTWFSWTLYTKKLMYICYVPRNTTIWFYIIYSSQVFLDIVALFTVLGYVYFFSAVVVNITIQYRILQYRLRCIEVNENSLAANLKCCIEYHAFLIR